MAETVQPTAWLIEGEFRVLQFTDVVAEADEPLVKKTPLYSADSITRLSARVEELERALKPFADEAEHWEPVEREDMICFGHDGAFTDFTMADVREAARSLLSPSTKKE